MRLLAPEHSSFPCRDSIFARMHKCLGALVQHHELAAGGAGYGNHRRHDPLPHCAPRPGQVRAACCRGA
eukprot:1139485-Pelagomonas_calceolata.AAC.11